jgi:universal stress protein F
VTWINARGRLHAQIATEDNGGVTMYSNILLPVAFEEGARHEPSIEIARALADDGATITLLHAFERPPAYAMSYIPADLMKATRDGIDAELQKIAKKVPGAQTVVVDGHPGRSICDWTEKNGVDLIVMASHRPGFSDVIWGSTAAHVVRHVSCAVHVQR